MAFRAWCMISVLGMLGVGAVACSSDLSSNEPDAGDASATDSSVDGHRSGDGSSDGGAGDAYLVSDAPIGDGSVLVGGQALTTTTYGVAVGEVYAFQFLALRSGATRTAHVYLHSSTASTEFSVGLYDDVAGAPGTLRTGGGLVGTTPGAWNALGLSSSYPVVAGEPYWVAIFNAAGGTLFLDVEADGGDGIHAYPDAGRMTNPWTGGTAALLNEGPVAAYITD